MDNHAPEDLVSKDCTHSPYIHAVMCPECVSAEIKELERRLANIRAECAQEGCDGEPYDTFQALSLGEDPSVSGDSNVG